MNALFIGRFQPFHQGHLHVIRACLNNYSFLYIGVGSAQYGHTIQNPFSFTERSTMINQVLNAERISSYELIPIPDIHDPPCWVDHIRGIVDDFDVVVTNNEFTSQLFQEKGYQIDRPGFFSKQKYSGERIRQLIKDHQPWDHLVHPMVYSYIKTIHGEQRIRDL